MPTYKSMRANLALLTMGFLKDEDVGRLLNKALEEEVESFEWSTLFKTGVIWGIPDNTAGTVNLVQGSKRVVGLGTSFPITFPDYAPPENWVIVAGGQIMPLEVETFVSPTELLLKEPWGDVTQSNEEFNLRPQFYSVPTAAMVYYVRQISAVFPLSRHMLSLADPARLAGTATPSVGFAEAGYDLSGNYRIELWLRPGGIEAYVIEFRERYKALTADNDWPQVPMNVLEQKALMYCYAAVYASKGDESWLKLAQAAQGLYESQRLRAIADDIERQVRTPTQGYRPGYEIITTIDQGGPPGPDFSRGTG